MVRQQYPVVGISQTMFATGVAHNGFCAAP